MSPMREKAFDTVLALSSTEKEMADTVAYLSRQLESILNKNETVLICLPHDEADSFGTLMGNAVLQYGGKPVFWENGPRWNDLLRLAFISRATTIVGPPLTILGLSKLAAHKGVPLSVMNAIITGYPCLEWMMDGIVSGLDCNVYGVLAPKLRSVVAGFSCKCGRGIHLRDDVYGIEFEDDGEKVPGGTWGELSLYRQDMPELKVPVKVTSLIQDTPCACGQKSPKLVNIEYINNSKAYKYKIMEDLLYWNSILDCWVEKTDYGLELDVVCFPGLKLPKFPNCAKLVLRSYSDSDIPFEFAAKMKKL